MKRTTLITPKPNEKLKEEIIRIVKDPDFDPRVRMRAAMIIMSSRGATDEEISNEFRGSKDMVKTWIERFLKAEEELNELSLEADEREIRKEIVKVLSDKRRSGAPKKFSDETIKEIKDLSHEDPQKYGHKSSRWTYQTLAKTAIDKGIVSDISMSSICRIFKKPSFEHFFFDPNII